MAKKIFVSGMINYPHLFDPRKAPNSDVEKYSVSVIIPKHKDKIITILKEAIDNMLTDSGRNPLIDGDSEELKSTDSYIEQYKDSYILKASSVYPPELFGVDYKTLLEEDSDELYSGCYCDVAVSLYKYNKKGNKGVGVNLYAVRKIGEGEKLTKSNIDLFKEFAE